MPDAPSTPAAPARLSIRAASVPADADLRRGLRCAALDVRAGEEARVETPPGVPAASLADLATGLLAPEEGTIAFDGRDWSSMPADESCAARGRIARVFSGTAWISNLDVIENILLPALHHTGRPAGELREAADALARRFGLDGVPAGRPAWTDAHDLQVCQWVRALLLPRDLAVLEDPLRHAADEEAAAWRAALDEARAAGLAVLWIATGPEPPGPAGGGAARRYRMTGGTIEPAGEGATS
jgi:ABC-type branched-subunit amino acid transport system ATPase component